MLPYEIPTGAGSRVAAFEGAEEGTVYVTAVAPITRLSTSQIT